MLCVISQKPSRGLMMFISKDLSLPCLAGCCWLLRNTGHWQFALVDLLQHETTKPHWQVVGLVAAVRAVRIAVIVLTEKAILKPQG